MAMMRFRLLIVVDTNTLVRGFANWESPSGIVLDLCERRSVLLLMSAAVVSEYRKVLAYPKILERNPDLTVENVESTLRRLRYVSDFRPHVAIRFEFPRDPDDQKFLELAIAGPATHIVTLDGDLLSLRHGHDEAAKRLRQRLPSVRIIRPGDFLRELADLPNPDDESE